MSLGEVTYVTVKASQCQDCVSKIGGIGRAVAHFARAMHALVQELDAGTVVAYRRRFFLLLSRGHRHIRISRSNRHYITTN